MIIGITGKKQAGKDTLANIIQYLLAKNRTAAIYKLLIDGKSISKDVDCNFEIKRFADILKDITCIITNLTREQLELERFKNEPLGKDWVIPGYYEAVSDDDKHLIFYTADAIEKEIFPTLKNDDNDYRDYVMFSLISKQDVRIFDFDIFYHKEIQLTPRLILQRLGTNAFRNMIHPDIWVNSLMNKYIDANVEVTKRLELQLIREGVKFDEDLISQRDNLANSTLSILDLYLNYPTNYPNWIIPDVRFPNEVKAITDKNGIIIRVIRPSVRGVDTHISETALDGYKTKFTIVNNGEIADMIPTIKVILEGLKLF